MASGYGSRAVLSDGRAFGAMDPPIVQHFGTSSHTGRCQKPDNDITFNSSTDGGGSHTDVPDAMAGTRQRKRWTITFPAAGRRHTYVQQAQPSIPYTPRRLTSSFDDEARPSCPHPFFATPVPVLRFSRHDLPPLLPPPVFVVAAAAAADVEAAAVDPPRQHKAA